MNKWHLIPLLALMGFANYSVAQTKTDTQRTTIEARNDLFKESNYLQYKTWEQTKQSEPLEDALAEDPNLVILWAAYPFSKDYNKPRGHFYAITDVRQTLRTGTPKTDTDGPLPMACWSCKSPDVGREILTGGEDAYFTGMWSKGGAKIVNPIGCGDCHDTASKDFKEGKPALALSKPHVGRGMDAIHKSFNEGSRIDQQSQVCGQCHVEYYFSGPTKAVKFPWDKGTTAEQMEDYYDEIGFSDWTHGLSKAPLLKAQHPEYETWRNGVHGKNNVSCVDCHMPKVTDTQTGKVYTDHKIGNPFEQFDAGCKSCHAQTKEGLQEIVASRKIQINDVKLRVERQLVHAHFEAKAAWDAGATAEEMQDILQDIRHSQWRWDYSIASHGIHAHAPDVALATLGTALDKAADARAKLVRLLAKKGITTEIALPDISTKDKAQAAIGLDMPTLKAQKDEFIKTMLPKWDAEAKENNLLSK